MTDPKNLKVKFKFDENYDDTKSDYAIYPISISYVNDTFEDDESVNVKQQADVSPEKLKTIDNNNNKPHILKSESLKSNSENVIKDNTQNSKNEKLDNVVLNKTTPKQSIYESVDGDGDAAYKETNENKIENSILQIDTSDTDKKNVYDEDEDDDDKYENKIGTYVVNIRKRIFEELKKPIFRKILIGLVLISYPIYFAFAMKITKPFSFPSGLNTTTLFHDYIFSNNYGLALFSLTLIAIILILWDKLFVKYEDKCLNFITKRIPIKYDDHNLLITWVIIGVVAVLCLIYLLATLGNYQNLFSLIGIFGFSLIAFFLSAKPTKVKMRPVVVGLLMQFILGVFALRSNFGYNLFKFLGDQIEKFFDFTDNGSQLVFGRSYRDHTFVFRNMPVLIFFSAIINVLYYYGVIQYFITKLAWVINMLMGTSPTESISATANIFIGQSEAPLLIKPFLPSMTDSELFAIMVGGFATVSGSILAAYIGFGIPSSHLLVASIMSAPAALGIAKMMYPETKVTKANWDAIKNLPKMEAINVFEVISIGAISVLTAVAAIVSNLIAFIAIFSFLNASVAWFLGMLGIENAGFTTVLQYFFIPIAALMGIPFEDWLSVSKLIAIKTFVNEFVAYKELGNAINFRKDIIAAGTFDAYKNGSLTVPHDIPMIWNDKSFVISTYALCGFSNFASIGVQISAIGALAPTKAKTLARIGARAMIAGNIACFMTACVSGLLYEPKT